MATLTKTNVEKGKLRKPIRYFPRDPWRTSWTTDTTYFLLFSRCFCYFLCRLQLRLRTEFGEKNFWTSVRTGTRYSAQRVRHVSRKMSSSRPICFWTRSCVFLDWSRRSDLIRNVVVSSDNIWNKKKKQKRIVRYFHIQFKNVFTLYDQ